MYILYGFISSVSIYLLLLIIISIILFIRCCCAVVVAVVVVHKRTKIKMARNSKYSSFFIRFICFSFPSLKQPDK